MENKNKNDLYFKCNLCDEDNVKQFKFKKHLYAHQRNIHKLSFASARNSNIKCSFCDERFVVYDDLRQHLITTHNMDIYKETDKFKTLEDFFSWKTAKENEYECFYTLNSVYYSVSALKKQSYYICHRSGKSRMITGEKRKRTMKSQGSCKMNSSCPSTIKLVEYAELIEATIWFPHTHEKSLRFINLSKEERQQIAGKLSIGVTFNRILDDIRDKGSKNLKRIDLLNRKDLYNIQKEFCIHTNMYLHHNDAVSVNIWVQNMKKLGYESPILYYKMQHVESEEACFKTSDFVLVIMNGFQKELLKKFGDNIICIDSTHGTNGYDFLLTSLLVVDEYGEGVPVAYLITNRTDTRVCEYFFCLIRDQCGSISAKVFMSDDDAMFYNAWVNAMEVPQHRLLCAWHIDHNWRKQLSKVEGNREIKADVYKCLRILMDCNDQNEFKNLSTNFLQELLQSERTKDFGVYFENHYANRAPLWAACFRNGLGINTNMYLEAFHKVLKHIYLEGKKSRRLDKTINALMKFTRDKLFDRVTKTVKGKFTFRINLINKNHLKANEIKREHITCIDFEKNVWEVKSGNSEIRYLIRKEHEICNLKNCQLRCTNCKICIHLYSCSCPDYNIKFTMCKHIHAVLSSDSRNVNRTENIIHNSTINNDIIVDKNLSQARIIQSDEQINARIVEKMNFFSSQLLNDKVDRETAIKFEKTLDAVIQHSVTESNTCSFIIQMKECSAKEPANKRVTPQIRFESTKKKKSKKSTQTLRKANSGEEVFYKHILVDENLPSTSYSISTEHPYAQKPHLFE